jgi:Mlc titration factor MtfA (ptsG expression regulator)
VIFVHPAQAMQIPQFDKMALQDQADYIHLLVDGAQKVLIEQRKDDLAAKVHKLFTEVPRGDSGSLGITEFERNLDRARLADIRNLEKDAHALRIEVEDAMAATLEANGIDLPASFFTVASKFRPRFPNQSR